MAVQVCAVSDAVRHLNVGVWLVPDGLCGMTARLGAVSLYLDRVTTGGSSLSLAGCSLSLDWRDVAADALLLSCNREDPPARA